MARIEVEVVGKDQGLTATLDRASNAAIATGKSIEKTSQSFYVAGQKITTSSKTIAEQVTRASTASAKLAQESSRTAAVLGGATVAGSNRAAFALTNLGRVAQDAPFGFIGIQNNLNPLLESFGQLRKETGSAGAAFRALGKSLIGPAGIGIALSVVSAAFLFYQQYVQRSKKAVEEAKETNEDYIQTLNQVDQARVKGGQSAQKELTILKVLYDRTQNVSVSQQERLKAVNQLQEKYPAYFKNVKDEAFLAGAAAGKYDELSSAIIATARARAAADLIAENQNRKLTNEQKITDLQKEQVKNRAELAKIERLESGRAAGSAGVGASAGQNSTQFRINDLRSKINDNLAKQRILATDIIKLDERSLTLTKSINGEIEKGADLIDIPDPGKEKSPIAKFARDAEIDYVALTDVMGRVNTSLDDFVLDYKKTEGELNTIPLLPIEALKTQTAEYISEWDRTNQAFSAAASQMVEAAMESGIGDIAGALGGALASGDNVLKAVGGALLGTIGDIAIQLGKAAIKIGIGMQAIKMSFKNPFTAIAAGIALIAIGSFINGKVSGMTGGDSSSSSSGTPRGAKIPGFASGVTNFEGGMAYVHAGEMLTNLPTGANVIPRAKTDRLLAGVGSTELVAETILRGQDILVAIRRTERKNGNI